jgi:hypothetical protein
VAKGKFCYTAKFADGTVVTRNSDREYVAAYRFTYMGKDDWLSLPTGGGLRLPSGFSGTYPVKASLGINPNTWPPKQRAFLQEATKHIKLEQVRVTKECN